MKQIFWLVLTMAVAIIQVSFVASFRNDWVNLNIILLLILSFYYLGLPRAAFFTGVFGGLSADLLEASGYIGLTGFIICVLLFFGMLVDRYTTGNRGVKLLYIFVMIVIYKILAFQAPLGSLFQVYIPNVVIDFLGFLFVVRVTKFFGRFWQENDFKQLSFEDRLR